MDSENTVQREERDAPARAGSDPMEVSDRSTDDSVTDSEAADDRVWDVGYDVAEECEYECLSCGVIVAAADHPVSCPTCDGALRNRSMPYE